MGPFVGEKNLVVTKMHGTTINMLINFIDFVTSAYIRIGSLKMGVNTSKHVGVIYEIDITVNILSICWSK